EAAVDRQRAFLFQDSVEVFAVHESHGDELDAVGFTQVVDAKNVFVRNSAGKQEFVFEALNDLRIAGKIRQQDFQRGVAIELTVVDLVNAAHTAFTEQRLDDETRTEFFAGIQNSRTARATASGARLRRRPAGRGLPGGVGAAAAAWG